MAVTSEDESKPSSDAQSTGPEEYEGDEGESYRGEEEEDYEEDEFDRSFDLADLEDDESTDDYGEEEEDHDRVGDSVTDVDDDGGSSDRLRRGDGGGGGTTSRSSGAARSVASSLPSQHNLNFAPPFYGRPPTPLPPSPSLTSLLRPSRPTTPDASDVDELENPVPRAAPQVPTYEYYGFVLYLFSSLAFLIYLLWSYLPSPFLHALGIYYYPNRWWSLAVPSFLVSALVYIYVALASYNTEVLTLPLDSLETIVDEVAQLAAVDEDGHVVVVGGADGRQVQGRGVTASASEHSGRHNHHHHKKSSSSHHPHHLRGADTIASWSSGSTPFRHQREPSSPSPPLGKAPRRERSIKNNRKNKKGGGFSSKEDAENLDGDDGGLTMSGRGRGWSGKLDEHEHDSGSHYPRSAEDWKRLWDEGTDAVMDIPLAGVCEVLYA